MHLMEFDFMILKRNIVPVMETLIKWSAEEKRSWVEHSNMEEAYKKGDIEGMFDELGWYICFDPQENIDTIEFHQEKMGDEELWLREIAPFVEEGSYLQMRGEDGEMWRWVFYAKRFFTEDATVVWGSDMLLKEM